jgi:hypothetical protein
LEARQDYGEETEEAEQVIAWRRSFASELVSNLLFEALET